MEETIIAGIGAQANKWHHYLAIYDRHFAGYRGKPVRVLEIGIDFGGSLRALARRISASSAKIDGIDIDEECRVQSPRIASCRSSEVRPIFRSWSACSVRSGELDIVIDDGSHVGSQQMRHSRRFIPRISHDGVYLLEDMCTNY